MTALKNDLLLRAAKGEEVERTPVWLMRQAGRILPQYRKVREQVGGFKELVTNPELICEVTLQPVDELGVDAAIIFSDILVIPEAMGLPYEMVESKGPRFPEVIRSEKDLERIHVADPSALQYVTQGIQLTRDALHNRVPLIGFAGAPWTIFSYMVEGGGSKTFSQAKRLLYQRPDMAHALLDKITESTIQYLKAQIKAGVDLVQVFDSWAGILSMEQYSEFGLEYIARICDEIYEVPITVFSKGAFFAMPEMGHLNCQVIGLDWTMHVKDSRQQVGWKKTLQGNLDPCVLYGDTATIQQETSKMLEYFGPYRHIANLGHGVYPDTPLDGVKAFVDAVQSYEHSDRLHDDYTG